MATKAVHYEIVGEDHDAYNFLHQAVSMWHEDLRQAKIALAWRTEIKPDPDGHMLLGQCMLVSDLQKEFVPYDFIIILNREAWEHPEFDDKKRMALLDHELCHATEKLDNDAEPIMDERGRRVWRTRKHDIEEFREIVRRHGMWKQDLELFAKALNEQQLVAGVSSVIKMRIDAGDPNFTAPADVQNPDETLDDVLG